jgi:hypothetical protein
MADCLRFISAAFGFSLDHVFKGFPRLQGNLHQYQLHIIRQRSLSMVTGLGEAEMFEKPAFGGDFRW